MPLNAQSGQVDHDMITPFSLQATIDPVSQGVGTVASAWVSAADFFGMVALIQTGLLGVAATVDAKLQQAQDGSGTGAQDVPGKAITQIVKATGDNKQAKIVAPRQQININGGYSFVRISLTVGGAASQIAASLFGVGSVYGPGKAQSVAASVAQIVR